jgi:hypothetical protein
MNTSYLKYYSTPICTTSTHRADYPTKFKVVDGIAKLEIDPSLLAGQTAPQLMSNSTFVEDLETVLAYGISFFRAVKFPIKVAASDVTLSSLEVATGLRSLGEREVLRNYVIVILSYC